MTQSLQELCELQIENEKIIRGASFLEDSDVIKVGALFYMTGKTVADSEKMIYAAVRNVRRRMRRAYIADVL